MIRGVIETIIRGVSQLLRSIAEFLDRYQSGATTVAPSEIESGYQEIKSSHPPIQYKAVSSLFTPSEKIFLNVLESISGQDLKVFGKIRVSDILTPDVNRWQKGSGWNWLFSQISHKHVDFVITDKALNLICAVELNDPTPEKADIKERDQFIKAAFESAHVPLVMIDTQNEYLEQHIADRIADQVASL